MAAPSKSVPPNHITASSCDPFREYIVASRHVPSTSTQLMMGGNWTQWDTPTPAHSAPMGSTQWDPHTPQWAWWTTHLGWAVGSDQHIGINTHSHGIHTLGWDPHTWDPHTWVGHTWDPHWDGHIHLGWTHSLGIDTSKRSTHLELAHSLGMDTLRIHTLGIQALGIHTLGIHTLGIHTLGIHTVGMDKFIWD